MSFRRIKFQNEIYENLIQYGGAPTKPLSYIEQFNELICLGTQTTPPEKQELLRMELLLLEDILNSRKYD